MTISETSRVSMLSFCTKCLMGIIFSDFKLHKLGKMVTFHIMLLFPLTPLLTLQKVKHTRHQFAVLVDELQSGDSTSDYQATVMTTIKCIVSTPQNVWMRVKLRNQFFGEYIYINTVFVG